MSKINEIRIDLNHLKILNLTINQLLTLIKIYFKHKKQFFDYEIIQEDLEYLRKNKYIVTYTQKSIKNHLREKGNIVIEKVIDFIEEPNTLNIKTESERDVIDSFEEKIKRYRKLFDGLKTGSMGSPSSVRKKMKRWMKDNPEVSFKEILEATELYIDSLNGDHRFLQRADYFIYKQNSRREEDSRLSIFIEELKKDPINSDWTNKLV